MKKTMKLPFMNVRDVVLFPEAYQQLYIGRAFTIEAIRHAKKLHQGKIVVITQKSVQMEKPLSKKDMFSIGTICRIENSIMMADGTMKVLLLGEEAVSVKTAYEHEGVRFSEVSLLKSKGIRQKLTEKEKRETLTLLIKWCPALVLNEDEERFDLLKKETELSSFVSTISGLISYPRFEKDEGIGALKKRRVGLSSLHKASPKELDKANGRIKKRQLILEEPNQSKRLRFIKKMLSEEIHSEAY